MKSKNDNISFSCEVFPPKRNEDMYEIYKTLDVIKMLSPDFISVTYGAGGSNSKKTAQIAAYIQNVCDVEALAHMTAVGLDEEGIRELLWELKRKGVKRVLALRGDKPRTMSDADFEGRFFRYASDLIPYIKREGDFKIAGACYPEIHPESKDAVSDVEYLKQKVDMGLDSLITQMFFDNEVFYRFRERIEAKGISIPVHAGIMPITASNQLGTSVSLSGSSVPPALSGLIAKYGAAPEEMKKAGIEYAIRQIEDLKQHGVDGIHLYSMNKADVTIAIHEATFA